MADQKKILLGCGCFCTILITSIILFACSFGIVELDEWGIVFDKNVQEIESSPYSAGRYLVGLGRKFITFPRGLVFIESRSDSSLAQTDTLLCWSKDGINIYIHMNFYFKLEPTKLRAMYFEFGEDWMSSIVRISQTAIVESTTKFKTSDFFTRRAEIDQYMTQIIQGRIDRFIPGTIKVVEFNLREFFLDQPYENAITDKLIQYQQKKTFEIVQKTAKILKETNYLETQATNNITMIYAHSQAKGNIIQAEASSKSFNMLFKNQTDKYKELKNSMGFDNRQLLQFIYADAIGDVPDSYILKPKNTIINI